MKHQFIDRFACAAMKFAVGATGLAASAFAPLALAQDANDDVLSLTAGISLTRDSNVPRQPSGASGAQFGASSLSDTYLKGSLGIKFDRLISQQRIQADAQVDGFKYNNYDSFDNVGYNAGLNYDWVIGRPFFGRIGGRIYKYEPAIQDGQALNQGTSRNQIERQFLYFNGGIRFTPSLAGIVGIDFDRRRSSLEAFRGSDADINGFEAGVRFAPGTGTELDLVYRRQTGDYNTLQTRTINGELLIAGISNDYKQDALLLRVQYRPTEESRIAGNIGLTRRSYDQFGDTRDFNGVTTGFDIDWVPSGITFVRISVGRTIEPEDTVNVASYAVATSFAIRPTFKVTGKIELNPYFQYIDRAYAGEVSGTAVNRKDQLQIFGIGARYEVRRNLYVMLDAHQEKRDSTFAPSDFTANIFTVGLQARF